MKTNRLTQLWLVAVVALALPLFGQEPTQAGSQSTKPVASSAAHSVATAIPGAKQKAEGVVARRDADGFILRQANGTDLAVKLTNATEVREKKGNPFRMARKYAITQLVRNLALEVEGRGDSTGALVADKIRFTNTSLQTAGVVESRVVPVEDRVGSAETRLGASEDNAKRLSGQIDELNTVANAAQSGAKAAQDSADRAMAGVNTTNERMTSLFTGLITGLDDYQAAQSVSVLFKVGSAVLTPEAKAALDQIANLAKTQKGFMIEVAGFASSEGGTDLNQRLSDRRAQAVVRHLAEINDVPLRRIITPFGYGASHPVSDNSTREGRGENRRVEVKLLVNRGLTMSAAADAPPTSTTNPSQAR